MKKKTKTPSAKSDKALLHVYKPSLLNIKRILVPVDFSGPSTKALKYAVLFAKQFGARLHLLHVVHNKPYPNYLPFSMEHRRLMKAASADAEKKMDLLIRKNHIENLVPMKTQIKTGHPHHEIIQTAESIEADVIIMATHGWTGLKHAVLGSNTERVVRHAHCPVLVVRAFEHDFI